MTMKISGLRLGLLLAVSLGGAGLMGCSSDDSTTGPGAGGSTGSGGSGGGSGGSTVGSGGSGGSSAGSGGAAGSKGGSGGGATDAGDSGKADVVTECGVPGVIHTAPTVPAAIAVPAGATLIAGYHASGEQIYTCTAAPDGGTGTWVNTAVAVVYGDNCAVAANHAYNATPSPTWTAVPDGSAVVGARVAAVPAPVGGEAGADAGATDIAWVLLRAASTSGTGIFTPVTYVQRVDTKGGVGPSGACDTGDAGAAKRVGYTATYFFYSGGNAEGGTPEAGEAAAPEASTAEAAAD